jgi:hypothetical protein
MMATARRAMKSTTMATKYDNDDDNEKDENEDEDDVGQQIRQR